MEEATFLLGETIQEFLEDMGTNRERFLELLEETCIDEPLMRRLPENLRVLVIVEPWSGDVLYFLPVLAHLARARGWPVRVFRRDAHPGLIDAYKKDGLYKSIPVFVFYDGDFKEIGYWVERPAVATRVIEDESLRLRRRLREENRSAWSRAAAEEIAGLLDAAIGQ